MISTLVIVGLALVWAVVLLPDLMARISRSRRSDTIRSFNSQLSSLRRSSPVDGDDNVIELGTRRAARLGRTGNGADSLPGVPSPYVGPAHGLSGGRQHTVSRHAVSRHAVSRHAVSRGAVSQRPVSHSVRKRRQDVLITLGAAALLTLLATVAFGGSFLYLHLTADVLMLAYLVALQRVVTRADRSVVPQGSRAGHVTVSAIGTAVGARPAPLGATAFGADTVEVRRIAN